MVIKDEAHSPFSEQVADNRPLEKRVAIWLSVLERCASGIISETGLCPAGQETADLVQETLAWATGRLGTLLGLAAAEAVALLQRVLRDTAANVARGEERRLRRLERYGELLSIGPREAPPADAEVVQVEFQRVLAEALKALPSRHREVVVGHFLQGRTWKEIARHAGCTERHARRLCDQALDILRRRLEGRV
jgi:RNA polymerase sigma factor (sigma-70 family)